MGSEAKRKIMAFYLFYAMNERKLRIEVGYGLEGRLPDGKAGRILDEYAIPLFEKSTA